MIGVTPLFKQNFLFLLPLSIIVLNDGCQKRFWIVLITPIMFYMLYLLISGAFLDAFVQLNIYTLERTIIAGLNHYFLSVVPFSILLWYSITYFLNNNLNSKFNKYLVKTGILLLFSILAFLMISIVPLAIFPSLYLVGSSYSIFAMVVGLIIVDFYKIRKLTQYLKIGILLVILSWIVSLSVGYNYPALMAGPLVIFIIEYIYNCIPDQNLFNDYSRYVGIFVIMLLFVSTLSFGIAREEHIYRESSISDLNYDLGDVVYGMTGIKTNKNTHAFLKDLNVAEEFSIKKGRKYIIIPDCVGIWIKNSYGNPLIIEWPQNVELGNIQSGDQKLTNHIIKDLEMKKGTVIIIVQKYRADNLSEGFIPLNESYSPLIPYVQSNYKKIYETQFFELYE
ncbi:MAG: hypothetical protein PQ975_04325 [Methanobacterium sp.]